MNPIDTNYMIGMSFSQLDAQEKHYPFMTAAELDRNFGHRSSISIWFNLMSFRNVSRSH